VRRDPVYQERGQRGAVRPKEGGRSEMMSAEGGSESKDEKGRFSWDPGADWPGGRNRSGPEEKKERFARESAPSGLEKTADPERAGGVGGAVAGRMRRRWLLGDHQGPGWKAGGTPRFPRGEGSLSVTPRLNEIKGAGKGRPLRKTAFNEGRRWEEARTLPAHADETKASNSRAGREDSVTKKGIRTSREIGASASARRRKEGGESRTGEALTHGRSTC